MSTKDCKQPPILTQHDSLHQRITHATTEIRHCKQRLVDFLYDRATASAACADFQTALRDATEIQALMPSSPMGFLCQGDIHRQQGRQKAAIEAYDKGLALSSLEDHQHVYDQLRRNKKDAEYVSSKRVDFITKLPMEIVRCFIIPTIMGDQRWFAQMDCPYLYVSHAWRKRVLGIDGGLNFYGAHLDQDTNKVVPFAPYIESLEIENYDDDPDCSNMLDEVDFPSLARVDIGDCHAEDLVYLFQKLGTNSSSNLTHLKIGNLHGAVVRMADVLSSCPRLRELVIRHASTIDVTGFPQRPFPSLKVLRMRAQGEVIDHDNMLSLLQKLPALEYLDIFPWQESKALTNIQQYCLSLKCLQYASGSLYRYWYDFPICPSQPGLQCIQIHDPKATYYDADDIDNLLKNNHNTLRVLDVCIGFQGEEIELAFPLLRHLVIQYRNSDASTCYGWWIPKYAPNLEKLEIDIYAIRKCPSLIESLQSIKSLRKLQFYLGSESVHPYSEDLSIFLRQQTHMQSLELFIYHDPFHDGGAWLTAIHNMPKLRCLDLLIHLPVPGTFANFMKGISIHCLLLEELHVRCNSGVTDEAVVFLLQMKQLKEITLPIKDMSLMAIVSLGRLKTLKVIKIIPGPEDDSVALNLLREARPDIHVTT